MISLFRFTCHALVIHLGIIFGIFYTMLASFRPRHIFRMRFFVERFLQLQKWRAYITMGLYSGRLLIHDSLAIM